MSAPQTEEQLAQDWWERHGLRHYDPQQDYREQVMKWAFMEGRKSAIKELATALTEDSQ